MRGIVILAALVACACGPSSTTHQATGRVGEVDAALGQIVIAHDDIEGLMPAMTMNFDVAEPGLLEGLAPGDRVRFALSSRGGGLRIVAIERIGSDTVPGTPAIRLADLAPEDDLAPDFTLVDQDGNERSLTSLRGRLVLLDFVYTSCPGPCPILTSTHVQVQRGLPEDLRERVWFASLSLDPERDTPERMREYGSVRGADFRTWSFLTGPASAVETVLAEYGVGAASRADGELQHVVVTFLIDGRGRILKRYFGLEHEPGEILRDLRREAAG